MINNKTENLNRNWNLNNSVSVHNHNKSHKSSFTGINKKLRKWNQTENTSQNYTKTPKIPNMHNNSVKQMKCVEKYSSRKVKHEARMLQSSLESKLLH